MLIERVGLAIVCAWACSHAAAADNPAPLKLGDAPTNFFADSTATLHVEVPAELAKRRVVWVHATNEGRVFSRGEAKVAPLAGANQAAKIELRLPSVKPGVILEGVLNFSILADNGRDRLASGDARVIAFPKDPFLDRGQWLKGLKITLYDPKEKTAAVFKSAEIPHETIVNAAALSEIKEGILVIGEGLSLREERGLAEVLVAAAAGGLTVLCLAPAEGSLPLAGDDFKKAKSFACRKESIITELDKRLDAQAWSGGRKVVASRLALRGEGPGVAAEVDLDQGDWPWLDVAFARTPGRLVVCGFGLVEAWDASPTPRFLLARILEHCETKSSKNP